MAKYFLFAGDEFYPEGGWEDFKGAFESLEAAMHVARYVHGDAEIGGMDDMRVSDGWWHVVDAETTRIVSSGFYGTKGYFVGQRVFAQHLPRPSSERNIDG